VVTGTAGDRARALLATVGDAVVVLDSERRIVAASPAAAAALGDVTAGRRLAEDADGAEPGPLILFLDALPELSAYQELRAGFTAAVSHELRTPLARMLVLLESATLPDADVDQLVDRARQEVQQARELIDDVLFLGELETGREVVTLGRTLALPVAEEVVAGFGARAERAPVGLMLVAGDDVELPLRPRMLRVVLENLITNAIRYAGPASRCTVSITQEGAEPLLVVADDGKGVSESELPRLFERFYRADQARSSRGTGRGLAIVKHVVTAAGGTVEANGGPGRGLEIVCRFPAA
jgi:signal transduction histidine kinase